MKTTVISKNLLFLRLSKGWTINQVAQQLHVSPSAYQRMEKNESKAWINYVDVFCEIYAISQETLLFKELELRISLKEDH